MIVVLEYLWWGVSIGGRHYTGEIRYQGQKVELMRRMSLREAKEYGEREERAWLRLQRETNKFDTLAQLERAAVKWCKANVPDPWLLQEYSDCNPERPIAATGFYRERLPRLRKVAKLWSKVPNSEREGPTWDRFYRMFYHLIEAPNEKGALIAQRSNGV